MRFIDISLPIYQGMPVYPGNQETHFTEIVRPSGSRITTMTFDTHVGSHIDSPRHSLGDTEGIEAFNLDTFYGRCRVVECPGEAVTLDDLGAVQEGDRVLLKTRNSDRGYDKFYEDWIGLDGDVAKFLVEKNIKLIGIDWLGIKKKDAVNNEAHTVFLERNIPVLEGIDLSAAQPGTYTLSAFPLKLKNTDGAQVRAILIEE